ncbi:MAG: serine protease [Bacteroidota bacterium]
MKVINKILLIILLTNSCYGQITTSLGDKVSTLNRIQSIKKSTCKVLVDKVKSGTGFFISSDGLFVTNWHVIFNQITRIDSVGKILSSFSVVNSMNDTLVAKIVLNLSDESAIQEASFWDYCILKIDGQDRINFLKLGSFSDAYEGAPVYTCGYPLDLNEPFITVGLISSFFKQSIKVKSKDLNREVAWLDLTTNKGNSGGPLVLIGEKPEDDRVICLTSFITTPNFNILENLNQYVQEMEKRGGVKLMGIDFLQYVKLINETANSNSVGISGCISIEKVSSLTKGYNK